MTQALHAAGLWTGLLIILLVVLSVLVVTRRRRRLVAFGDGGHADLTAASRAFGNASEYAPVGIAGLILLALLGAPVVAVHAVGATLFLGRIVHALGLLFQKGPSLGRILGMVLTYLALIRGGGGADRPGRGLRPGAGPLRRGGRSAISGHGRLPHTARRTVA